MSSRVEQSPPPEIEIGEIEALLATRAAAYFSDVEGSAWKAELVRDQGRSNSRVYEFRLFRPDAERLVIVKLPYSQRLFSAAHRLGVGDRPRVCPAPDPFQKGRHEFDTLCRIHEHFSALQDDAFGTIRPLEWLPDHQMMVMEKGPEKTLSDYYRSANRIQGPFVSRPLQAPMRLSGRWLREFHQLPAPEYCTSRSTTAVEFVQIAQRFWQYLLSHARGRSGITRLQRQFERACEQHLPEQFVLGLSHGDFAPRNLLVEPGRVTGFDTQARWQCPIYEDIAHFLVALHASGLQVSSRGLLYSRRTIDELEAAFLSGYFQESPPLPLIRLFECQRLLEWWTSLIFRYRQSRGWRSLAKRSRAELWQPAIRAYVARTLGEAGG